jgi:predicted GH43/DUF377 family glycosyl hydrolase
MDPGCFANRGPFSIFRIMVKYILILTIFASLATCHHPGSRKVLPAIPSGPLPDDAIMAGIYEQVKTPYKFGVVLREEGKKVDCPGVFRHGDHWYMTYIIFDGTGYETALAKSSDLLHWEKLGKILRFSRGSWDDFQKAGFIALQDYTWGGSYEMERFSGRYWMSYVGGKLSGYETDPLSIGIAWTDDPTAPVEWSRLDAPVLSAAQQEARDFEKLTLYKSHIIRDPDERLGYPFIMYYNAKSQHGYERIAMAVSKDLTHWTRYGHKALIDNGSGISGDPQIAKLGNVYVMFYFGAFFRPKAFDTFACSYDLVNWKKWDGPDLVYPSEPWDSTFAHKPWVIQHQGMVYHYYCAVGDQGRVIALATSERVDRPERIP